MHTLILILEKSLSLMHSPSGMVKNMGANNSIGNPSTFASPSSSNYTSLSCTNRNVNKFASGYGLNIMDHNRNSINSNSAAHQHMQSRDSQKQRSQLLDQIISNCSHKKLESPSFGISSSAKAIKNKSACMNTFDNNATNSQNQNINVSPHNKCQFLQKNNNFYQQTNNRIDCNQGDANRYTASPSRQASNNKENHNRYVSPRSGKKLTVVSNLMKNPSSPPISKDFTRQIQQFPNESKEGCLSKKQQKIQQHGRRQSNSQSRGNENFKYDYMISETALLSPKQSLKSQKIFRKLNPLPQNHSNRQNQPLTYLKPALQDQTKEALCQKNQKYEQEIMQAQKRIQLQRKQHLDHCKREERKLRLYYVQLQNKLCQVRNKELRLLAEYSTNKLKQYDDCVQMVNSLTQQQHNESQQSLHQCLQKLQKLNKQQIMRVSEDIKPSIKQCLVAGPTGIYFSFNQDTHNL